MNHAKTPPPWLCRGWFLARIPVLAILALVFREPVISFAERLFDLGGITVLAIGVLGTPLSRIALLMGAALGLVVIERLLSRTTVLRRYFALVSLSAVALGGLIVAHALTKREGLLVATLVASNFFPLDTLRKSSPLFSRGWDAFAFLAAGISELFFLRALATWLSERWLPSMRAVLSRPWLGSALSALIPALSFALLAFQNGELFALEQAVRLDDRATKFAAGDYNWIELDSSGRYLFATGHSVASIERFDTQDLKAPPMRSAVSTGHAQGFAYDASVDELYVIDTEKQVILVLRAADLAVIRQVPIPDLSPGDPWLALEPRTNTMTVLSEADIKTGVPFQVLDRTSGEVLYGADEDPGNVLVDPRRSLLYLGYFRRGAGVRVYDLAARGFGKHFATKSRPDRLAYVPNSDEVLVALPTESKVLRLRAGSLEPVGEFKTVFGVRTFAIDANRQLLFCGSLATGMLAVLNLKNGRELARAYISPWLRTLQADTKRQVVYLSSNGALYTFDYRNLAAGGSGS